MKRPTPPHLERFLRRVHRRMIVVRGLERMGICLLCGCAAALILLPVLLYRGQPTQSVSLGILGLSLGAGFLWSVIHRPTPLAAAMEADRQLKWSDLLTTAWMMRTTDQDQDRSANSDSDSFISAVLICASTKCAATSPSTVILNRFGRRAWGGIGLAVLLAGVLSLLGAEGRQSQAIASAPQPQSWMDNEDRQLAQNTNITRIAHTPDFRRPPVGTGTDDTDPTRSPTGSTDPANASATNSARPSETGNSEAGTGAGVSQSASKGGTTGAIEPVAGGTTSQHSGTGQLSSGGTGAATDRTSGNSAGGTGSNSPARPTPPWKSSNWATDQALATQAIRAGKVPDQYRDLVREYFEAR